MTPEEQRQLSILCKSIQNECDPKGLSVLIEELNKLLDAARKPRLPHHEHPEMAGE